MIKIPGDNFYVYTLAEPSGKVFYIGKGSGNRAYYHLDEARRGNCTCQKCETIQRIWRRKKEVKISIVFETNSSREALRHEAALIRQHSMTCKLCNTRGIPTKRQKEKQKKYSLRMKKEAEWRLPLVKQEWKTARQQHWGEEAVRLAAEIERLREIIGDTL